jgi:hypothetical protein
VRKLGGGGSGGKRGEKTVKSVHMIEREDFARIGTGGEAKWARCEGELKIGRSIKNLKF